MKRLPYFYSVELGIFKKHSGKQWNHYLYSDSLNQAYLVLCPLGFDVATIRKGRTNFLLYSHYQYRFLPITECESQNRNKKIGTVEACSFEFSVSLRLGRLWVLTGSKERVGLRE